MICIRCKSDQVLKINAKCSDMCFIEFQGRERDGYVPHDLGVGGGDYVNIRVCLNCGQVQDAFPKTLDLYEVFGEEVEA